MTFQKRVFPGHHLQITKLIKNTGKHTNNTKTSHKLTVYISYQLWMYYKAGTDGCCCRRCMFTHQMATLFYVIWCHTQPPSRNCDKISEIGLHQLSILDKRTILSNFILIRSEMTVPDAFFEEVTPSRKTRTTRWVVTRMPLWNYGALEMCYCYYYYFFTLSTKLLLL